MLTTFRIDDALISYSVGAPLLAELSLFPEAPIHIRGELQGVLCLEQVGSRQPWTSAHGLFAQAVANLVTLALVEYEAEEAKLQALAASERLKAVCAG